MSVRSLARIPLQAASAVLDLVAPRDCRVCGRPMAYRATRAPLCEECDADLVRFESRGCPRCGEPRPAGYAQVDGADCPLCRGKRQAYDAVVALGPYEGLLRRVLLEAKRPSGAAGLEAIGHLLLETHREELAAAEADAVVSVPGHWRRRLASGADSAGTLADALSRGLRLPRLRPLVRSRPTARQREVAPSRREANVRGAFAARGRRHCREMTILLVDDVLTTGATMNAVARALKGVGATRVVAVVAARRVARA